MIACYVYKLHFIHVPHDSSGARQPPRRTWEIHRRKPHQPVMIRPRQTQRGAREQVREDSPPFSIEDQQYLVQGQIKKVMQPKEHPQVSVADDRLSGYKILLIETNNKLSRSELSGFFYRLTSLVPFGSIYRHFEVFYKGDEVAEGYFAQVSVKPTFFRSTAAERNRSPCPWAVVESVEEVLNSGNE